MRKFKFTPMLLVALCIGFTSCENDEPAADKKDNITISGIFENISNDEMVEVKGGSFLMGAQKSDESQPNYFKDALTDESPVHNVTLNSFYIGKYEVTQQLWEYVMNYSGKAYDGSTISPYIEAWINTNPSATYGLSDNHPAYNVSYDDIVDIFIPRLNKITGRKFRLPTEAEWEYAARGGQKSNGYIYSGSSNIDDVAWHIGNSSPSTHVVGNRQANELGIYDMTGNVAEWCSDWYQNNYYASSPSNNPTGPADGTVHVFRGGSWMINDIYCRVSYRSFNRASYSQFNLGFRLALDK